MIPKIHEFVKACTVRILQGRSAKHARQSEASAKQEDPFKRSPHSFVFHRGHVGKNIGDLVKDVRRVMEPFTASSLKVLAPGGNCGK